MTALVPLYFRGSNAVIVVYDITRQKTFDDAKNWVKELGAHAPEDVVIAVTGNKSDLDDLREIERHQGERYAKEVGAIFNETSAKSSSGVADVFLRLGRAYLKQQEQDKAPPSNTDEKPIKIDTDRPPENNSTNNNRNNNNNSGGGCPCGGK